MYQTFIDELLGYDFTIYVKMHPNGYTFETEIEKDGVPIFPLIKSEDEWLRVDDARHAARLHAWSLIHTLADTSGPTNC